MALFPSQTVQPVLRFAPSPNGRLHLGHAFSALTNQRLAQRMGGRLLLRIEDIDPVRCTPALERDLRDDLAWLGVAFDPEVRRQSEHFSDYAAALDDLRRQGLVYPCFCTRQQLRAAAESAEPAGGPWPRDPDGSPLYGGCCRRLDPDERDRRSAGEPHVLRLDMTRALALAGSDLSHLVFAEGGPDRAVAVQPARWGDVVLARKDVPTSYHLAVVLDDALQGVTHVVRGADLEAATDIHVLLQKLLGLPTPRYHFHALLTDEAGHKLAKSRGSRSLADLRAEGVTAEAIRARLGFA